MLATKDESFPKMQKHTKSNPLLLKRLSSWEASSSSSSSSSPSSWPCCCFRALSTTRQVLLFMFVLILSASVYNTAQVARMFLASMEDMKQMAQSTTPMLDYQASSSSFVSHFFLPFTSNCTAPLMVFEAEDEHQQVASRTATTGGEKRDEDSDRAADGEDHQSEETSDDTDDDYHSHNASAPSEYDDDEENNDSEEEEEEDEDVYDLMPRVVKGTRSWEKPKFVAQTKHRRLNFMHIPKTGGSSVVEAGIRAGINWGDCLFQRTWPGRTCPYKPRYGNWPKVDYDKTLNRVWWHIPLQFFPQTWANPYKGFDLFAIIRNPYDRMVSEFYYHCKVLPQDCKGLDPTHRPGFSAKILNGQTQQALKKIFLAKYGGPDYFHRWGHYIPQYDFFVGPRGQRYVQHLLHTEYLEEEFNLLMEAYQYDVTLPQHQVKSRTDNHHDSDSMDVRNFTVATLKMIEVVYEQDFLLGGYPMISDKVARKQQREQQKNKEQ
jgi:hypothetical protein